MNIISLSTEGYASNSYLVSSGTEGAIIDPSAEPNEVARALEMCGVTLKYIILTHGHFDHMLYLDELRREYSAELCIHALDAPNLADSTKSLFMMIGYPTRVFAPAEVLLADGDEISVGDETLRVIHTPGHTPGSVMLGFDDVLVTGDTLFDMSVGRCDFPGGDADALSRSIFKIYDTFDDAHIYPGHGAASNLEKQKKYNPFTKRR